MNAEELRAAIATERARVLEELKTLVRIPSIAFPGYDDKPVRASAETTGDILEAAGFGGIRLIELPDVDHPAVFGEVAGPAGAPTVLLYAHHDVQPEGPLEQWTSPPFEPEVRDGRLYGRGTSDDKCGIVMHAAAMRAWGGKPPVNVKVLVEGEEEASAEHLPFLIGEHKELLSADVIGVADGGNWRSGIPTLEISIRGVVDCIVTVRSLDLAVHSGSYGGPAIDAISALARVLTTLHDDEGQVAIEGLTHGAWEGLQLTEEEYREDTPLRPSVTLVGSGSISERLWSKPAVAVLGLDAPRVVEASNQLVPVASAKVSLRLAPEEDARHAMELLTSHLAESAPWGVEVDVAPGTSGQGMRVKTDGPGFAAMDRAMRTAFGREVVQSGSGGSVPLVPELSAVLPDAEILMYGASDEQSQYHSVDESVDLGDLERVTLAEALLFGELVRD
jgi:acetylornithine deacetylase/succinyl-diaminopimelate desuccinylase-like protein